MARARSGPRQSCGTLATQAHRQGTLELSLASRMLKQRREPTDEEPAISVPDNEVGRGRLDRQRIIDPSKDVHQPVSLPFEALVYAVPKD